MPKNQTIYPCPKGGLFPARRQAGIFRAPFRACPDEDREFGVIRKIKMSEI